MPEGTKRTRLKGTVTSVKMHKTVIVSVQRRLKHPTYKKYITRSKKFPAHDEQNRCKNGDLVEIVSTRPLSRTKHWAVARILKTADASLPLDAHATDKETVP